MSLGWKTYQSRRAAEAELVQLAAQARRRGERAVVVVRSYSEEVRVKHLLAAANAGFGVAVAAFDHWVADLWELFGDGRALVDPVQRGMFLRAELQGELATSGYVALLERACARGFAAASAEGAQTEAQRRATETVLGYGRHLSECGLVEPTEAMSLLLEAGALDGVVVVAFDLELSCLQADFLEGAAQADVIELSWEAEGDPSRPDELARLQHDLLQPDFSHPITAAGHVRFALPSGDYAAAPLVADELKEYARQHPGARMALAAPDPGRWFDRVSNALAGVGMQVQVRRSVPFEQTRFGSAWTALLRFVERPDAARPLDVRKAGDFALSAFSAIAPGAARICDSRFRGARAQTVDDALTDLTAFADDEHRDIAACVGEGNWSGALAAEWDWVASRTSWPETLRAESLAAIACARRVHSAAAERGLGLDQVIEALAQRSVRTSAFVSPAEPDAAASVAEPGAAAPRQRGAATAQQPGSADPQQGSAVPELGSAVPELGSAVPELGGLVQIMTLEELAARPASAYDCVALVDLTADAYALSEDEDASDALLDAWGAGPLRQEQRGLLRSRTQLMQKAFTCALAAARDRVLLSRPLCNADGDEQRPSALFEELVDCYRSDPQNADEVDEATGLTPELSARARQRGEEDAAANLACGAAPELVREIPLYATGAIDRSSRDRILLPRLFAKGEVATDPYLSPSAIESYLECPYLWFARRRLRLDTVDADFGGIAFGNFAHGVLERFHARLRASGARRVTPENLEASLKELSGVFDERLAGEQLRFAKDALIPLDELDRLEVEQLRRKLEALVEREALLLPDFAPLGEEISFGEGDDEFVFAGVHVNGKVDRIDVDPYGRAVVIDYKGAVGKEYSFRQSEDDASPLPRKMQTLIYAQMARRKLGLVPVGAIYLSYGKDGAVRGLFDRMVLDGERDLLGASPALCGTAHFLDDLDAAEAEVERRVAHLLAGDIPPAARDLKACEYCPVGLCERRDELAAQRRGGGVA